MTYVFLALVLLILLALGGAIGFIVISRVTQLEGQMEDSLNHQLPGSIADTASTALHRVRDLEDELRRANSRVEALEKRLQI